LRQPVREAGPSRSGHDRDRDHFPQKARLHRRQDGSDMLIPFVLMVGMPRQRRNEHRSPKTRTVAKKWLNAVL
jgi:hypothetical protein